jgi:hypothetical protein
MVSQPSLMLTAGRRIAAGCDLCASCLPLSGVTQRNRTLHEGPIIAEPVKKLRTFCWSPTSSQGHDNECRSRVGRSRIVFSGSPGFESWLEYQLLM